MSGGFLSEEERGILREAHLATPERRIADRIKAVLMLDKGWSAAQVAEALLIDDATVRRHLKLYQEEGIDGLAELHYMGGKGKLSDEQEKELGTHLDGQVYASAEPVVRWVQERFEVAYTQEGMVKLLRRLGFVYKKTKQVPGKADPREQEAFIRRYRRLKKRLGPYDKIYFADGVHPLHNSQPGYGWIRRGKIRQIKSNTGRKRININGAIDVQALELEFVESEAVNAQSTIELTDKLEAANPKAQRILLITDNARYYKSKLLRAHLRGSKVKMLYLPPYSPNLNLIERLWRFLHKEILINRYYETFDLFKKTCTRFLDNLHLHKDRLRSLLTENFPIVDPAQT